MVEAGSMGSDNGMGDVNCIVIFSDDEANVNCKGNEGDTYSGKGNEGDTYSGNCKEEFPLE